jgi:hypothetical protein
LVFEGCYAALECSLVLMFWELLLVSSLAKEGCQVTGW